MSSHVLLSGIDTRTGETRLISEVERGNACNCHCPNPRCKRPLVARKGEERIHHFAHQSANGNDEHSLQCRETALHNAAKRVIAYHLDHLYLEPKSINFPPRRFILPEPHTHEFKEQLTPENGRASILSGAIEPSVEGTARTPDVILVTRELGKLYVEVCVSNPVDGEKRAQYEALNLSVLEIDLSLYDPQDIDLPRLFELVQREAKRSWISFEISERTTQAIKTYEGLVARSEATQERLVTEHLQKNPEPRNWFDRPASRFLGIYYLNQFLSVNRDLPTLQARKLRDFWVSDSITGSPIPVFFEPSDAALNEFKSRYKSKKKRDLSYVTVKDGAATAWISDSILFRRILHWVLENTQCLADCSIHQVSGYTLIRKTGPLPHGMKHAPNYLDWCDFWADPPLTRTILDDADTYFNEVSRSFAESCIKHGVAKLIVNPTERNSYAVGEGRFLEGLPNVRREGVMYGHLRNCLTNGKSFPCRMILEHDGYSRSIDITKYICLIEGQLNLKVWGVNIPLKMDLPAAGKTAPIHLIPGLSDPDSQALFRGNPDALEKALWDSANFLGIALPREDPETSILTTFVESFSSR